MASDINISPIKELNTEPTQPISKAVIKAAKADSEPITPVSTTLPDDSDDIKYTHFLQQTSSFRGPASLRILMFHFNQNFYDGELAKFQCTTK